MGELAVRVPVDLDDAAAEGVRMGSAMGSKPRMSTQDATAGSVQRLVWRVRDVCTLAVVSFTDPKMADEIMGHAKCELLRKRGLLRESSPNAQALPPGGANGGQQ